jgi:ABC-type nickel/cobalt efflux system permease component RcnA
MRKALALSLIVTVLGVAAYIFKPSEKQCVQKTQEEFRKKISYTVEVLPKGIDKN